MLILFLLRAPIPTRAAFVRLTPLWSDTERIDATKLQPFLERGVLALIESNADRSLKQITLIAHVAAPPEEVFRHTVDLEKYPDFLRNVVKAKVEEQEENGFSYRYELEVPLSNMEGKNHVILRPPHHADFQAISGDIETGRWHWEFQRTKENETIVLFSNYSDIREIGWIMRKIVATEPLIEHGINVGANYIHLRAIKNRAEGKPPFKGKTLPRRSDAPISLRPFPHLSDPKLRPLLNRLLDRGMVALIEEFPDGALKQISICERVAVEQARIYEVVADYEKFPEFIDTFKKVERVRAFSPTHVIIHTVLGMPFLKIDLDQEIFLTPIEAIDTRPYRGDIKTARWMWRFFPLSEGKTLMNYSFYADMSEASWLLRQFLKMDPTMLHAMNVTWGVVAVQVMKKRAETLAAASRSSSSTR